MRERIIAGVCMQERTIMCVCVCVGEREREAIMASPLVLVPIYKQHFMDQQ